MEHSGALFDIDDAEIRVMIIPPVFDGDTSKQATEEDHTHTPGRPCATLHGGIVVGFMSVIGRAVLCGKCGSRNVI